MPSTYDRSISSGDMGSSLDGFFSFIGRAADTIARVAPLWSNRGGVPQPTPPQPTSISDSAPTTGSQLATAPNYMPLLIAGGIVAAVLLLK